MIAIISDIHGNFPALEAVMAEIERNSCETIISLGDVAGYYCQINECIELLRHKNVINTMGNHDDYIVNNRSCPRSNSANDLLNYQRQHITSDNLAWLKNSPVTIERDIASFVHGGWNDPLDEYLTDPTGDYFKGKGASFFFSGHTHVQSLKILGRICHCNPGSVGQPRDNDPRAAFALFGGNKVYLQRVSYDIDKIARAMERSGFNRYYYAGLYTGLKIGAQQTGINRS
jgi:predicted phosphodiesterase